VIESVAKGEFDVDTVTAIRIVVGFLTLFVLIPQSIVAFWKIFSKAGFSGWLALLMIVPLVNLIVLCYVAFSRWKTQAS
jgi:uncharacterized membrane protein YhaH (DUF805 family)